MDLDLNGIVTKDEILKSVMKDIHAYKFNDTHVKNIVFAVEEMI